MAYRRNNGDVNDNQKEPEQNAKLNHGVIA